MTATTAVELGSNLTEWIFDLNALSILPLLAFALSGLSTWGVEDGRAVSFVLVLVLL